VAITIEGPIPRRIIEGNMTDQCMPRDGNKGKLST
jgi:hypothetical protein